MVNRWRSDSQRSSDRRPDPPGLLPHLQPLSHLRSQRHTRHLQPFHHPIPEVLLGRAVLPSPLRSQHQLRHHTQPRQRAICIRQLKTPPRQSMPFRPRLAIRSCTRSDAVQRGDEGVGIDGRFALGFGVVRIVLLPGCFQLPQPCQDCWFCGLFCSALIIPAE